MLIFVVLLYVVCWGPLLIFNVLQSFGHIGNYLLGVEKHLKTAFSLMAYFNRYTILQLWSVFRVIFFMLEAQIMFICCVFLEKELKN